jgi:hypothetical protein
MGLMNDDLLRTIFIALLRIIEKNLADDLLLFHFITLTIKIIMTIDFFLGGGWVII